MSNTYTAPSTTLSAPPAVRTVCFRAAATLCNAASLAFNTVTVNPALAECATPESMGRVIGFGGTAANAARIVAPVLWGNLFAISWRYTYYVSAFVAMISATAYITAATYGRIVHAAAWVKDHATALLVSREALRTSAVKRTRELLLRLHVAASYHATFDHYPHAPGRVMPLLLRPLHLACPSLSFSLSRTRAGLMNDLEHVLMTRGYACEDVETEGLCRKLIDRAFPDLMDDSSPAEQEQALREQLAVLDLEKRNAVDRASWAAGLHA